MKVDRTFGARLLFARLSKHISESDLAERVGVHRVTVQAWQRNEVKPEYDALKRTCLELAVSADWLLFGDYRLFHPVGATDTAKDRTLDTYKYDMANWLYGGL